MIQRLVAFLASMLVPVLIVKNQAFAFPRYVANVQDVAHEWTAGANSWLSESEFARDVVVGVSSLGIDVLYVAMAVSATLHLDGASGRLVRTMVAVYGLRQLLQTVFFLPTPAGFTWKRPDFGFPVPSLTVHYAHIQDFFYSGHVAICVIGALYFRERRQRALAIFAVIQALYQAFVVLATRCHYSIDVVAGAVFAHYFWTML